MRRIKDAIATTKLLISTTLVLFAVVLGGSTSADAGLIGTTVTFNYHLGPNPIIGPTSSTDVFTVTGGVNITCPGAFNACSILTSPVQTITVGDNSITWAYDSTAPSLFLTTTPNQFDFEGLNPGSPIIGVSLTTNIAGLTLSDISFTGSSVQINDSGLVLPAGHDFFTVTLEEAAVAPVPEPTTLIMLGGPLVAIGWANRRRRKQSGQ